MQSPYGSTGARNDSRTGWTVFCLKVTTRKWMLVVLVVIGFVLQAYLDPSSWISYNDYIPSHSETSIPPAIGTSSKSFQDYVSVPPPYPPEPPDVCELAKTDFRNASGLFCIVTGMEHSGTTLMVALIMSAPNLFGGYECGMLCATESPENFTSVRPFYNWMGMPHFFGMTEKLRDEYLVRARCFAEMYRELHRHSLLFQAPQMRDSWVVDKTPRYIGMLPIVMKRTPGVPIIITRKSRDDQIRSFVKHGMAINRTGGNLTAVTEWAETIWTQKRDMFRAAKRFDRRTGRILVVNMTNFYQEPNVEMTKVFEFLGLQWKPEYLTMQVFNTKRALIGVANATNMTSFDNSRLHSADITKKAVHA